MDSTLRIFTVISAAGSLRPRNNPASFAGMADSNIRHRNRSFLKNKQIFADPEVNVRRDGGKLSVDLHIVVTCGLNISDIVKSIVSKVRYTVEEATGLDVQKVNVFVDAMKND